MISDAHCHFFSTPFFTALARQRADLAPQGADLRGGPYIGESKSATTAPSDLCRELQWDDPGTPEALADRWIKELDAHGVNRAALIASMPRDETSVAAAVARHPSRIAGLFMLDPAPDDAPDRTRRALTDLGLKGICLFPAMHHVPLHDDRTLRVVEAAGAVPGAAVFVHCGVLSVGVRRKLGLPSRFDLRLGDPLAVAKLAMAFPRTPFIVPHFGAGLLREALMAADTCANIYFDTSSSNSWVRYTPGLTLEEVFRSALAVVGPSRLLFGTDSSFFPRGWQRGIYEQQKAILDRLSVSPTDQELIFGRNFERMFPRQGER
jgi:predicted TIM-barrel fold metal-dependent hydrolase